MYKGKIVVIDLETTGLDIYYDEIIEFAALCVQDGIESETRHFLIQPTRKAPERVLRLTGITADQLQQAEPLETYREQIISFLENAVIVGHNVRFDLGMLENSLNMRFPNRVWDTLELTRIFFPTMNQYRLGDLAKSLGLEMSESMHRALPDVQVAWRLLQACWDKGIELDLSFYQRALPLVADTYIADFFKELEGIIKKRFPDRPIRTDLALRAPSYGLFSQPHHENYTIPENGEWIETCFGPGGILEKQLAGYESRKGQYMMAKAVTNALESSGNLIAEAGTGTGKSYAYLIPGLWWSKRAGKKVVVATHTIPLQEQLYKKDLPVLAKVLPFSFNGALLKGKGNYLCIKKWLWLQGNYHELGLSERISLLSVMIWLRETENGDWQEVAQIPGLSRVWSDLNAEYDGCIPGKCSESERCFMLQARKKAEEADVIIINHSLLFSDIKTGNNVLPEYHELVIDEAHHLHQSALEQLGREISLEQISRSLDLLHRPMGGSFYGNIKARSGFWSRIVPTESWERFSRHLEELPDSCREIYEQAEEVYRFLAQILGEEMSYRFTAYSRNESWWETLAVQFENLHGRLGKAHELLRAMLNSLSGLEIDECDNLCYEIAGRARELEEMRDCFALALQVEEPTRVTWLEKSNHLTLKTSPVDVSKILKEKLFSKLDSAILTSATVSVAGSFRHFLADVGLPGDTPTILVDSPFDYEKQMRLLVVKDLLDSKQSNLFELKEIVDFIAQVTRRMQGRTLVLFTSHRLLRDIHPPLKARLEEIGLELFAQGLDGSRKAILEEFLKNSKSVLLGANSFWEGIDIPGEKLSCVVLIKLPFWPPNMPLIAARSEYLEAQGKNSFNDFLLPEAVLRFKQGFGRLIRSKSDRGLVILCDARAIEKRYGKVFLTSLPLRTHTRGSKAQILDNIDCWLDEQYQNQALL